LVQRGDNLVLLVFESAKTGDIIQGLPRIEELWKRVSRRKHILAHEPGVVEITRSEDEAVGVKVVRIL